jgi:hypothetical protein
MDVWCQKVLEQLYMNMNVSFNTPQLQFGVNVIEKQMQQRE